MTTITRLRLALMLVGLLFFVAGMRTETEWQRWTGISVLAVAVVLRFVGKGERRRRD